MTHAPGGSSVNLCTNVATFQEHSGYLILHGINNSPPYNNGIDYGTYTVEITATASNGLTGASSYNVMVVHPCSDVVGVTLQAQRVKPDDMTY